MLKYKILKINGLILGEKKKPMYSKNRHFGGIFFVVFLACALGSCTTGTHYTNNATILQAEALLNSSPDSAWQLLETIPKPNKLPERDYAAWCLMHEHARYKCDDTITSDSLIQIATNYYDQTDDDTHAGLAWYVCGVILMDLKNEQASILCLKKAEMRLKNTSEIRTLGLVYYSIGILLQKDRSLSSAMDAYKKSLHCFEKSDTIGVDLHYVYAAMGTLLSSGMQNDTLCDYFHKAQYYALQSGDTTSYDMNRAIECMSMLKNRSPKEVICDIRPAYNHFYFDTWAYCLGQAYNDLHQYDSVKPYLSSLKNHGDSLPYFYLKSQYERNLGQAKQALDDLFQAYALREKDTERQAQAQAYRINKRYDLEREQERAMALTIDKQRLYLWVSALTIGVILLVVLALWLVLRSHQERARHALKQLKTEAEMERLQTEVRAKRSYLRELLIQKLEVTQELQVAKIQKRYTVTNEPDWVRQLLSANTFTTPTQWKVFITQFNTLYNNALDVLPKRYPLLTDGDLVAIGLFSLEFNITQTCILLNRAKQSIYSRRVLIKHHLGVPLDTDLEAWSVQMIQEFL